MEDRIAWFTAFATLGVVSVTHELAGGALAGLDGADPELVAEETLCLVATATARAAEVGLREQLYVAEAAVPALLHLPYTYRDYLVGGAMIARNDPSLFEAGQAVYGRLQRKQQFYLSHLPANQFPGERALSDKMLLWMGRISPPRQPDSPEQRLDALGGVATLVTHLKLVLAFARQDMTPGGEGPVASSE